MADELEGQTQALDRWLKEHLQPSDDSLTRVWGRVNDGHATTDGGASGRRAGFGSRAKLQLAAAAAAILVIGLGAGLLGSRFQAPQEHFATSVVPAQAGPGTSLSSGQAAAAAPQDRAAASAAGSAAGAPGFYGGSCSQAPTVQIQGRGVTATGFATVNGSGSGSSLVSMYVQAQGADANAAAQAVESKTTAVLAALAKAGLAADQVQQTGFNVYSGGPNQASAMAYVQAHVTNAGDVPKIITAAIQGGASSAYSGTPLPPDSSTDADLRDAVSRAAGQAKTMATSTASAIGDQIAQLQTIVTQPPQVCYGPAGAQRVVAVTVTYSLK